MKRYLEAFVYSKDTDQLAHPLRIMDYRIYIILQQKALIRLHGCTGCSEPLLST